MREQLLTLVPKRFLCPYCGKWHDWGESRELNSGDTFRFKCDRIPKFCYNGDYQISFEDDICYYAIDSLCDRAHLSIKRDIAVSAISESADKPIVTFEVPFEPAEDVGSKQCSECIFKNECSCVTLGDKGYQRYIIISLGFEFDKEEYDQIVNMEEKKSVLPKQEEKEAKKQEDITSPEEQVPEKPQVKEYKEDTNMAGNFFGMNLEFGPNKDENIASTLMGVAVKNGDNWRIYDKQKKEIIDVGDIQLGDFPIFIMPTFKLREGDLIKDGGEYYFVTKVATPGTMTETLSARTGEMKTAVPIKNILGFKCYTKVIALGDSLNMGDDFDAEKLLLMSAMCGQVSKTGDQPDESNGQMNQLLPLLLFKDKLDGDDDAKKMLVMSAMYGQTGEDGGQMNQLLPLLLFKDKLGGDDDTMKLVVMSSMMGSNVVASKNPLLSYLMFDAFLGKKDEKSEKVEKVEKIEKVEDDDKAPETGGGWLTD